MKFSKPFMKILFWWTAKKDRKRRKTFPMPEGIESKIGLPYVENGDPRQVVDIYYAKGEKRKNKVVVDIHGGFYVMGDRDNNFPFANTFLQEGYDLVLIEYRLNDGKRDVFDELSDCATAIDFLVEHAEELGLNMDDMYLTGDSAGGHMALYMAEGIFNESMPIRPRKAYVKGVMVNCPAYDFAAYGGMADFSDGFKKWYLGPRYKDVEWAKTMSSRTYIESYKGPLFLTTCTNDFLRNDVMKLKADREEKGLPLEFLDIVSEDKKIGHVHNVIDPRFPESQKVNRAMVEFLEKID